MKGEEIENDVSLVARYEETHVDELEGDSIASLKSKLERAESQVKSYRAYQRFWWIFLVIGILGARGILIIWPTQKLLFICISIGAVIFATLWSYMFRSKINRTAAVVDAYRWKLGAFEMALRSLLPRGRDSKYIKSENSLRDALILLAAKLIKAEIAFKQSCKVERPRTKAVMIAAEDEADRRMSFESVLEQADREFGLTYDKKELFRLAKKSLRLE